MASTSLHVRNVEKLANGEYRVQVSCPVAYFPATGETPNDAKLFDLVTLPASTSNIERLNNPAFVSDGASAWLASRGDEWDAKKVQEYLQQILEN